MSLPMTCRSAGHQWANAVGIVREAGAGDVVDERVVPDVDDPGLGIPRAVLAQRALAVLGDRERDAPTAGRALARDREVLEAAADEAEHLVAPVVRLDEVGVVGEMALEALLVGRQPEEPVLLGQPLERDLGVVRADRPARRLLDVGRVAEALVRAVPALVRPEIDVAVGVGPPDHLLGRPDVVRIGRPDEAVRRDGQGVLGHPEEADLLVDERARRAALVERALGDVDGVLVGAGQEPRVVADHPVPAGDDVGADDLVERVQARLVVGVGDGRGQVVTRSVRHGSAMVAATLPPTGTAGRSRMAGGGRFALAFHPERCAFVTPPQEGAWQRTRASR